MTFTVEPMINECRWEAKVLEDGWTAVTIDGHLSAQFEHTVLVTENGYEVLTRWESNADLPFGMFTRGRAGIAGSEDSHR